MPKVARRAAWSKASIQSKKTPVCCVRLREGIVVARISKPPSGRVRIPPRKPIAARPNSAPARRPVRIGRGLCTSEPPGFDDKRLTPVVAIWATAP